MTDTELIDAVAKLWVRNGSDSEGFLWLSQRIRDRIAELREEEA